MAFSLFPKNSAGYPLSLLAHALYFSVGEKILLYHTFALRLFKVGNQNLLTLLVGWQAASGKEMSDWEIREY